MTDRWWDDAECLGADVELFYRLSPTEALGYCGRCPVVAECLRDALRYEGLAKHRTPAGVRGGKTAADRARLLARRGLP